MATLSEEDLLDKVADIAETLYDNVLDLDRTLTIIEKEDIIFNKAFLEASDFVKNYAIDYLQLEVRKAAAVSKEYDYPPFLIRLLEAIRIHQNEILQIVPHREREEVEVIIDMSPLGDIDEYVQVVRKAKEALGLGKIGDSLAASKIWREKIYRVDREGGTVPRTRKDRKTGSISVEDVTSKYKGKYERTILTRLAFLSADKAPYWYLLEHGTTGDIGTRSKRGTPYPSFGPTNFVSKSEFAIAKAFKEAFQDFRTAIEDSFADSLIEDYLKETGKKADTIKEVIEVMKEAPSIFIERGQVPKPPGKQTISKITVAGVSIAGFIQAEKAKTRGKSIKTGRFVSLK